MATRNQTPIYTTPAGVSTERAMSKSPASRSQRNQTYAGGGNWMFWNGTYWQFLAAAPPYA